MPSNPNKLSQFWQELKRRKVVRVITVYAGAAFVILELTDIITEPLNLPSWLLPVVIVLLSIGFIIAIILSWVYDIHPEGGIVKTEPVDKVKEVDVPKSSNSWKIASYISFVVIVGLIVLNIIPRQKKTEIIDRSIAVLPFRNDSPDEEKMYFINGTMEAILNNLCKIQDLRVVSRNSVEQYRNNPKPTPVVAEEMDVSYVLEGSGQKVGNRLLLTVQLIVGKDDRHIWSRQYDREIDKVEDLIDIQKEIAQMVANEIEAIITPEEKKLIEKIPTSNLTAYDFYQRGLEEYWKYRLDNENREALERAEDLYHYALEYDSTFAQAYAGLAWVYWHKQDFWEAYFSDNFLDSVPVLANIALSYDDQLAEAYDIKGVYYHTIGKPEQAIKEYEKAIKFNPNYWLAYLHLGQLYIELCVSDLAIHNLYKASLLHRGPFLPRIFESIAAAYRWLGLMEHAKAYLLETLKLNGDTVMYFNSLSWIEEHLGNYAEAIKYFENAYAIDANYDLERRLGYNYMFLGQFKKSLKHYEKYIENLRTHGDRDINNMHRIGYVYWQNGYEKEAEYYFNEQIIICNGLNELQRDHSRNFYTYYDLAGVYAFRGEKDKAFDNLRIFNQKQRVPFWMVILIKNDPLFDSIRDEPEFQQIVSDVEAKYQVEYERVRKWLEENDML